MPTRWHCDKKPLRGKDAIALAVGAVINHYKMGKHFTITVSDDDFVFTRKDAQIAAETALDGTYVLRTSVKLKRWIPMQPSRRTSNSPTSNGRSAASKPWILK